MKATTLSLASLLALGISGAALAQPQQGGDAKESKYEKKGSKKPIDVKMMDAQGKSLGTAKVSQSSKGGVEVKFDLKGLPPGAHAVEIHENAKCEGPDFKSSGERVGAAAPSGGGAAGGESSMGGEQHAQHGGGMAMGGELPGITADSKGQVKTTVNAPNLSLEGPNSLENKSIVILTGEAPSTDSAGRIACGTIMASR
ncbi:MAG: superoxide dismutase family protein [Kofleriaceae bacterium]